MQPHILQLHDWHAAAAALLFWECYHGAGLWRPRMVLTIHNMENTGECKQDEFAASGMSGEVFATADKALDERTIGHNPERINLMKVWEDAVRARSRGHTVIMVRHGVVSLCRGKGPCVLPVAREFKGPCSLAGRSFHAPQGALDNIIHRTAAR